MMVWPEILLTLGVVAAAATVVLNIVFAIAVYADTQRLVSEKLGAVLVPGYVWAVTTLFGGVFVAIGYWVIHRSSIASLEKIPSDFDINDFRS